MPSLPGVIRNALGRACMGPTAVDATCFSVASPGAQSLCQVARHERPLGSDDAVDAGVAHFAAGPEVVAQYAVELGA